MTTTPRASQPASNGRLSNIISRITSPFSPKPKSFSDFYITTAEDPRPCYAPGDSVKGWVYLIITKPTRVTHIAVYFHGFVKVYKHATAPGDGNPIELALHKGSPTYGSGSASIFEQETMVCGDGRLSPGRYCFEFNLKFPKGPLPSSIDFERGTISYVISAILTRPTTINPTIVFEKKVELVETVDVSEERTSKPAKHIVSLQPLTKRKTKKDKSVQSEKPSSINTSINMSQTTRPPSSNTNDPEPGSPSISELSTRSGLTSSSNSQPMQAVAVDAQEGSQASRNSINNPVDDRRTITAQVDLLRTGYLPGDLIPIKVSVRHTKHVQIMQGVIVTFYRKARVDSRPDRSLTKTKSKSDYGSRSRTAFGGLSFAPPRPDHTFRMDLAQTFAPLITNPNTLVAETKTSIRIPDDMFPTITSVPDEMIYFTYHLEVIMDVNRKLTGIDRFFSKMSITNDPSNPTIGQASHPDYAPHGHMNQFLDTTAIRRKDSVPETLFDIIIGTKDGQRKASRRPLDPWDEAERMARETQNSSQEPSPNPIRDSVPGGPPPLLEETPRPPPTLPVTPMPLPEPEEEVDEKTRLRRAEQRLFPSRPEDFGSSSSSPQPPPINAPSAPTLDDISPDPYAGASAPAYDPISAVPFSLANGVSHRSSQEVGSSSSATGPPPTTDASGATEDKHELERQRLLAAASVPDYRNEDDEDNGTAATSPQTIVPTAPVLDEDAEFGRAHGDEGAPRWDGRLPPSSHAGSASASGATRDGAVEGAGVGESHGEMHGGGREEAWADHEGESELPSYQR
ncbi:MAG: ph-response sensor protein [Stictis urceolatum]|nr:ph-response sensor protein [Stictis urceolata]